VVVCVDFIVNALQTRAFDEPLLDRLLTYIKANPDLQITEQRVRATEKALSGGRRNFFTLK
jgi:hypothetical protein